MENAIRLDKYLWAIRMFKTRSESTEACKNGRVKVNGVVAKASRDVKAGDRLEFRHNVLNMEIEVINPIKNRVNATLAVQQYKDLTSAEEYERVEFMNEMRMEYRQRGTGRPTKKERRDIEDLKGL